MHVWRENTSYSRDPRPWVFPSLTRRLGERIDGVVRSEEHTSELQSLRHLVCRLLLAPPPPTPLPPLFPYTTLFRSTADTLSARVLTAEHQLYPHALMLVASGHARVEGEHVVLAGPSALGLPLINPPLR